MKWAPEVTPDMVKAECRDRIVRFYSIEDQLNTTAERGEGFETMRAYIDACREASRVLRQSEPIRADFRKDKHWPEKPK